MPQRKPSLAVMGAATVALLLAGCASDMKPQASAQLGSAQTAIASAERSGALQAAPVELQSARNKVSNANIAMERNEPEQAMQLAEEAEVEAELADVKARRQFAENASGVLQNDLSTLEQQPGPVGQPRQPENVQ